MRKTGACQRQIVLRGAEHLANWIELCGNVPEALGGYNTGECRANGYARRVIHEKKRLEALRDVARSGDVPGLQAHR
jgi:hypothetical protein